MGKDNYLFISDAHEKFAHPKALAFCVSLMDEFSIPQENVYGAGDMEDNHNFGRWLLSPDRPDSGIQEVFDTRKKIKLWGEAFPLLKQCESNHMARIAKKAFEASIPSIFLKEYKEIFEYPPGWQMQEEYVVFASKHEFCLQHGDGFSGSQGHIKAAMANGMSTAIGHLHCFAGVTHINTRHQRIWAANAGCLIDSKAYAFEYGKHHVNKPTIGTLVILDGGRWPIWVPLDVEEVKREEAYEV